jgi:hypothetical protein
MNTINEKFDFDKAICRPMDANVTLQQLRYGDVRKFLCWGLTKPLALTKRTQYGTETFALRFFVSGMKFKGHIYIVLNGADLYDVYYCTTRGTIKMKDTDIYADMLTDVIDERIERVEGYEF